MSPDLSRPLCVDLDGTLIKSDSLFDAFCELVRRNPLAVWRLPLWLMGGRACVKIEIARRAPLDATRLPYNLPLLRYLQAQWREGRPLYLATGADAGLAERVAAHLGIFQGVLGTEGKINLTKTRKLSRLKERFGQFDYVGNSHADVAVLAGARVGLVANPTPGLRLALRMRHIPVERTFIDKRPTMRTLVKAIRLHQWTKNVLLFAPLLLSHQLTARSVAAAVAAFFCFCFMASANYLVNDMLDIESDRRHRSKRLRPFAAGDLSVQGGIALSLALFLASVALLPELPRAFALWLGLYIIATLSYSLYLKRVAVVDVLLLSGLYTLRLLAGGAATGTEISQWLAGFSSFLFLSLAMVKRFSEIENLREKGGAATDGRGYLAADLEQIRSFGTSSAYAAVVVFMLYIARPDVTELYRHATRLWLIVPLLIYWLNRVWLLASRGELDDDPVVFAMRDGMSLAVGAAVAGVALLAM
ncbi:MAG TPA: UbiA family prenyltransferase [Terracidiphilus sp.]|jgi:4-hydroxybenzoate polyprenyltransferase|nr:UbiA family prenyltransferase [Terracidiphilus sp.]